MSQKMKHYYIRRGEFANVYDLRYTESAEEDAAALEQGYERIPRREAERLCAAENYRRAHDYAFSGYADNAIYPLAWPDDKDPSRQDGYIVLA